jgi:hypothetical protein
MPEIRIVVEDEEQYERMQELKEAHGVTWRGMLLKGATQLDSGGPI